MNILHLSDIHFGRNYPEYGLNESFEHHDEILDGIIHEMETMDDTLKQKIELIIQMSQKCDQIVSDVLDPEFVYVNIDGVEFPEVPEEWGKILKDLTYKIGSTYSEIKAQNNNQIDFNLINESKDEAIELRKKIQIDKSENINMCDIINILI